MGLFMIRETWPQFINRIIAAYREKLNSEKAELEKESETKSLEDK